MRRSSSILLLLAFTTRLRFVFSSSGGVHHVVASSSSESALAMRSHRDVLARRLASKKISSLKVLQLPPTRWQCMRGGAAAAVSSKSSSSAVARTTMPTPKNMNILLASEGLRWLAEKQIWRDATQVAAALQIHIFQHPPSIFVSPERTGIIYEDVVPQQQQPTKKQIVKHSFLAVIVSEAILFAGSHLETVYHNTMRPTVAAWWRMRRRRSEIVQRPRAAWKSMSERMPFLATSVLHSGLLTGAILGWFLAAK